MDLSIIYTHISANTQVTVISSSFITHAELILLIMDKNPLLVALETRIRSLRIAKGYSQEEFAFKASLARGYHGEIERGERNVATLNLYRIAKALNADLKEIFDINFEVLNKSKILEETDDFCN